MKSKISFPFQLLSVSRLLAAVCIAVIAFAVTAQAQTPPVLSKFLDKLPASEFVDGATGYGAMLENIPAVPVLNGSSVIGYAYITSDFVSTTGYSGKPIHVMVAVDRKSVV